MLKGFFVPNINSFQPRRRTPGLKQAFVPKGGGTTGGVTYVNRVFDTVANGFVRWNSTTTPDTGGTSYPGPGTFGVDTSDYCIDAKLT